MLIPSVFVVMVTWRIRFTHDHSISKCLCHDDQQLSGKLETLPYPTSIMVVAMVFFSPNQATRYVQLFGTIHTLSKIFRGERSPRPYARRSHSTHTKVCMVHGTWFHHDIKAYENERVRWPAENVTLFTTPQTWLCRHRVHVLTSSQRLQCYNVTRLQC